VNIGKKYNGYQCFIIVQEFVWNPFLEGIRSTLRSISRRKPSLVVIGTGLVSITVYSYTLDVCTITCRLHVGCFQLSGTLMVEISNIKNLLNSLGCQMTGVNVYL